MGHGVKKFIAEENWLQNCKYLPIGCIDCILMICGPLAVKLKLNQMFFNIQMSITASVMN